MKKIIILIEFFSEDYYESLDLIHLSKFFEINVICYNLADIKNNYQNIKIISLKNDNEAIEILEKKKVDFFFIGIYPLIHKKVFNYIKLKKFYTCSIHYLNPTPASKSLISSIFKFDLIKRTINVMLGRLFIYDIVFTAGKIYQKKFKSNGKINLDTVSREYFFWLKKKKKPQKKNFIVFIDDGVGDHFDEYLLNRKKNIHKKNKYYLQLNNFLSNIQKETNKKVVVSLHPKRKKNTDNPYKLFQTDTGKTFELISECDFVIASNSLAIHYAILFNKPIILVTTSSIPINDIKKFINSWAREIKCNLIDISKKNFLSIFRSEIIIKTINL